MACSVVGGVGLQVSAQQEAHKEPDPHALLSVVTEVASDFRG